MVHDALGKGQHVRVSTVQALSVLHVGGLTASDHYGSLVTGSNSSILMCTSVVCSTLWYRTSASPLSALPAKLSRMATQDVTMSKR